MDPDPAASSAQDYSQLNDDQLRSAIRFAEKRIRWVEEDHAALLRAYRDEITAMRRHLFDRVLGRLISANEPLSADQKRDLRAVVKQQGLPENELENLIRATTKGRTHRLDALTEIEAMALLLRFERDT